MTLAEGKHEFIQTWGTLGSKWGINRTMAQVHALLLICPNSLCADDIMAQLNISRGNANMNLRALIDWGLVKKELKPGQRKEFFYAEKDMWKVSTHIIRQRKKRELEPIRSVLEELKYVEGTDEETLAFQKTIKDLNEFSRTADKLLEQMVGSNRNWLLEALIKMLNTGDGRQIKNDKW